MVAVTLDVAGDFPSHLLITLFLLLVPVLTALYLRTQKAPAPPGPRGLLPPRPPTLPIIGNLHQLGELPHRSLRDLSDKHGPIMHMMMGRIPTLVVSSAELAEEVLKTRDTVFAHRPPLVATRRFSYGGLGIAFTPYDEQWRKVRKLSTSELFSGARVLSFRRIREEEVDVLVRTVAHASRAGVAVNLTETSLCYFNNVTCRQVFGRRSSAEGECGRSRFHDQLLEALTLLGGFCAGDFFPAMEWLNWFNGVQGRLDRTFAEIDGFLEGEIERRRSKDGGSAAGNDFISTLLRLQDDPDVGFPITKDRVKAILVDAFFGGTDTSGATVEWGMTELMRHPAAMSKAQEEIRRAVGAKGTVAESDLPQLHYLKLVIKETLRLHPPIPLLLPRESSVACVVGGYQVPAGTRVVVNAWAVARDGRYWEDPEAFRPDRFQGSPVEYKGQDFQLLPFGSGRRICPGIALGTAAVELAMANLLYCFDWEPAEGTAKGEDIDVEESFGLVVTRKSPLLLNAKHVGSSSSR